MSELDLSSFQLSVLTAAAARSDGAIVPPQSAADRKPVRELIVPGLVAEIQVQDAELGWRQLRGSRVGIVITDKGRDTIDQAEADLQLATSPSSKVGQVISFLQRPHGASLTELASLTGWKLHSVRAALSTLRQKGMEISRHEDDARAYYRAQ